VDHCKYHPLKGATYICEECAIYQCDKCVDDESRHNDAVTCFICGSVLTSLGSANTVSPFWRRLSETFKYPINRSSISIIVITSIFLMLAMLIPFGIILYLFAAGSMLKYSFTCLMLTAQGKMKAPHAQNAYQDGIKLLFQLVIINAILALMVAAVAHYMGTALGGLLALFAIMAYPAILIRFALTGNMLAAINPLSALSLITAIGLPYGLLIAFILIMMTSVGVLHGWLGELLPTMSYLLQTIVSSYYLLVVFHLMGYMLFQYQNELGFVARADDENKTKRSDVGRTEAKIDVMLKEGNYEQVVKLYTQAFERFPLQAKFYDKYFDFLYACKKKKLMTNYAPRYLDFYFKQKRVDKLSLAYKQILVLVPEYLPDSPAIRLQLAGLLKQQGDIKLVLPLINGMHKRYPEYLGLIEAYTLLAESLAELPNMQLQAEKCGQFIQHLKRKAEAKQIVIEQSKNISTTVGTLNNGDLLMIDKADPEIGSQTFQKDKAHSKLTLELVPLEPT